MKIEIGSRVFAIEPHWSGRWVPTGPHRVVEIEEGTKIRLNTFYAGHYTEKQLYVTMQEAEDAAKMANHERTLLKVT